MIFDCQLSRGRARALGCQRCFEVVLIRTAIRFSSTAAALPSHAPSMHHDTPSEEVAVLAHAYGTGRTCLYRSAVDARLAGRLHARAQGSSCGGDWRRAAACCALRSCQARPMMTDDAQLEGCGTARSSTLSVFATAGASRSSPVRPAPRARARLWLRRRLAACCCVLRLKLLSGAA
eukprot:COSAG06_NODE_9859_length_1802_cov_16.537874_3_plen_176_part_01